MEEPYTDTHYTRVANEIGWLEKQCEQNSADNVEPKFNVGDKIISTMSNIPYYVTEVRNGYYLTDVGCVIMFNAQDNFELSNQNPAWSEEDEKFFNTALWHISYSISNGKSTDCHCATTDWLKSLKERVQFQNRWKPSDEQMQALSNAGNSFRPFEEGHKVLWGLYNDLKKLREE